MMEQRFFAVVLGVVTASVAMLTVGCGSGAHGTTAYTTNAIQSDAAAQPSSAGNADSGAGGSNPGTGSSSFGGTASGDDAGADASLGFGTGSGDDASADAGAPCSNPDNLEGCTCSPGQTQKCYAGNPAQAGVGVCTWGTQSCVQSGEFSQWGPCTGSGAPTPAACDGIDHLCNGMPNVGCACTTGATQNCYDGPPGTEGVGTCVGGSQTCVAGASGGSSWGPCNGEVLPTAEVCTDNLDHSCSGLAGCQNPMCSATAGCIAQQTTYCNEGGMVYVNDVSYTGTCEYGSATLCSGDSSGNGAACGPTLGQGGTFNTRCAGTYQVCGRVVSNAGCTIAKGCVSVTVPTDNATVPLPAFPGFGPLTNACLDATCSSGSMSTSLDVTGMTTTGIAVSRPNVATNIDTEYWGGGGGGSGSGGGGF